MTTHTHIPLEKSSLCDVSSRRLRQEDISRDAASQQRRSMGGEIWFSSAGRSASWLCAQSFKYRTKCLLIIYACSVVLSSFSEPRVFHFQEFSSGCLFCWAIICKSIASFWICEAVWCVQWNIDLQFDRSAIWKFQVVKINTHWVVFDKAVWVVGFL